MKVVILAGGLGTRMQEVTNIVPKPMIEVGGRPILWHIMKLYSHYGLDNFCVALGYKSEVIKEYFINYKEKVGNVRVDIVSGERVTNHDHKENWIIDLVETGKNTQTGGRVARLKNYVSDETFCVTYGDGVADIDINELLKFHRSHGKIATVSAVRPPARFGGLEFTADGVVSSFTEKPIEGEAWINGGFFVFEPEVFKYLSEDESCVLEHSPLENLTKDKELMAYQHHGYWQCMDTLRDVELVNNLWSRSKAPWAVWR